MWKKQNLAMPKQLLNVLTGGAVAPFSLAVAGQKLAIHNWTHGKHEASGRYLSPENAVKALQAKFMDYADPNRPKGEMSVVCFLVATPSMGEFIAKLESVVNILDYSDIKQALQYAKAYENLETTKMVKKNVLTSPAFGAEAELTTSLGRTAQQQMNEARVALANDVGDVFEMVTQLKNIKEAKDRLRAEAMQKLVSAMPVEVWSYQARGELDIIAPRLLDNLPGAENVFSLLITFIGKDLGGLSALIQPLSQ